MAIFSILSKQGPSEFPWPGKSSDNTLKFSGQKPTEKNENEKYERYNGQLKSWDVLVSSKVQKIAKKRAMKLILTIMQHKYNEITYIESTSSYKLYKDKAPASL